jgi:hypothetical protein
MPGSFDFNPSGVPLATDATQVGVYRYDPGGVGAYGDPYEYLPNVFCDSIQAREGPRPPVARFHYLLDDSAVANNYPTQFEDLWPIDSHGPYVVRGDDRLVVLAGSPNGGRMVLFDGFAQEPRVDLTPRTQEVSFTAVGVAVRCWDEPIGGRRQRDADDPKAGAVVTVDHPARFNPDGNPNCTPAGFDVDQDDPSVAHPVFLEPNIERDPDPRAYWTLGKFVRYILAVHNDESFVANPDFTNLDAMLEARSPKGDQGYYGPTSGDSIQEALVLRDFDATNMAWPEALERQLGYAGFALRFVTSQDEAGEPRHTMEIYRKDATAAGTERELALPSRGDTLDPSMCNVSALHLARDGGSIVNAITVETRPRRVELSVVLAPGFTPVLGDETASARTQFLKASLDGGSGAIRAKYRLYVADEAGDGHWDHAANSWSSRALDLASIFPDGDDGGPTYVRRLRPGSYTLISTDTSDRPLKAQLALSRDYAGPSPSAWDGSGTWQPISGGWRLLEDRLGIEVTAEDPEAWAIGSFTGSNPQEASQTLRGITSQANPSGASTRFFLRLTTVIDDDLMVPAATGARRASPTRFVRRRRADARDHFRLDSVAASSLYNPTDKAIVVRDDTEHALAHARQLRAAHEFPPLVGDVTIPSFVSSFRVGDRISRINGRDLSFRTNFGGDQGEPAAYPVVVAVTWNFVAGRQETVLQLADRTGE